MEREQYFCRAGRPVPVDLGYRPEDAFRPSVWLDSSAVPGCMCSHSGWFVMPCRQEGLVKHKTDEILIFVGGDPADPENLNGEIELQLEQDKLTLTHTCVVFIPAGAAHGNLEVKRADKPILHFTIQMSESDYSAEPAAATAPVGTYANHVVERYEPVDGSRPEAPPGFLTLLLWLDSQKLKSAPYLETVWFHTTNDTGPEEHMHDDLDELIGFFGTDPEHPDELGGEVQFFVEGEPVSVRKSCIIYLPRGVRHSPILVPELKRPIIHFSAGNGGDYARK
ncbi:MAG: hypothetical protein HFF09_03965 [Oscillospiraceae bacterium]|nr:hypothetical protein [Oscillospiraceae bacterium]